jgi:signal transduction histidine kinase
MISRGHRRRLNRALHELRRPLQALTLLEDGAGPPPGSPPAAGRAGLFELVRSALDELDRVVNGGEPRRAVRPFHCRDLLLASLERWRPAAAGAGGFKVFWDAGPALVEGDPVGMAQAFDNLIANALEHGGPPLVITGATVAGKLRVTVANGRPDRPEDGKASSRNGDPRHGHGTAVVSEVASVHEGRFALCRTGGGCVAALELPLADPRYARAA